MTEASRRRWRPSLQLYLLSVLILALLVAGGAALFARERSLDEVRSQAQRDVEFLALRAAQNIDEGLATAQESVTTLAGNPALAPLFGVEDVPEGCTLTFNSAGPFTEGRIDIVDADGRVLCSSGEVPEEALPAGTPWSSPASSEPGVQGPIDDPISGHPSLVVTAPVGDVGVVVASLGLESARSRLHEVLAGPFDADVALIADGSPVVGHRLATDGTVAAEAPLDSLGWQVQAAMPDDVATSDIRAVHREVLLLLGAGLLLIVALIYALYRSVARPIEQLSATVRATVPGKVVEPTLAGPAEVAGLSHDFAALTLDVASQMSRREQAEQDAYESEDRYRRLFTGSPLPMWIYDVTTLAFVDVNDAAVATYGYSREEMLRMTIADIRPEEDVPKLRDSVVNSPVLERSGPWRHRRADGEVIEVEITSHVVEFDGRDARFVMAEDVTERERTRRLLEQTARMESLGQLAGGIAHDVNNVLAVMLNYAEFATEELAAAAEEDPRRWEPVLHDVRQIGVSGARAAALTRRLLSFARGDTAQVGSVDLNEVVSGIEDMLRRTLGADVELRLSLAADLRSVTADATELEQVLVNLAVNARDAMPHGGSLSIETDNLDVDDEHHESRPELEPGCYVRLRISDTGVGMDKEALDRAFEPLFTTKPRGTGTGLGLATVYGIVARAGGTVHIYSEPGFGTSLSVVLPAAEAPVHTVAVPAEIEPRQRGSETILVVEDDDDLRTLALRILEGDGYHVLTAPDGATALEVVAQNPNAIDLVLSDVVMPNMLGSELARELRAMEPGIRILFMSGYAPPVLEAEGTLAVGAPLVDKPFSVAGLIDKVRQVLDGPPPPTG